MGLLSVILRARESVLIKCILSGQPHVGSVTQKHRAYARVERERERDRERERERETDTLDASDMQLGKEKRGEKRWCNLKVQPRASGERY